MQQQRDRIAQITSANRQLFVHLVMSSIGNHSTIRDAGLLAILTTVAFIQGVFALIPPRNEVAHVSSAWEGHLPLSAFVGPFVKRAVSF